METVKTRTGKSSEEITIENILNGSITSEDIKISAEVLLKQAKVAAENGRMQLARNFIRAAELTVVPDDMILKIYDMLRPNRSTKKELLAMAAKMKHEYGAENCSEFILETIGVYEKRGILKEDINL